jgi:alpha-tubulin suppressor-like RCC1 family protein
MKWGITTGIFAGMATRWVKDSAEQWYVWGANVYGTFGDGTTTAGMCGNDVCDPNPKVDAKLLQFQSAVSSDHALGISKGGKLFSWGRNDYGQLGKQPGGTDMSCAGGTFCNPTPSLVQGL